MLLDLSTYPLWATFLLFAGAAAVVWFAGTRIAQYANTVAERTGIGKAILGLLLLGGVTSLPEVAVSVSAGLAGNAALAVNTLLGGVAMQVAILAIADAVYGKDAISSIIAQPVVLLQAALDVLLLIVVSAGITIGEVGVFGIGVWSALVFGLYLISIWLVKSYQHSPGWRIPDEQQYDIEAMNAELGEKENARRVIGTAPEYGGRSPARENEEGGPSMRALLLYTGAAGVAILIAGFFLSRAGEALAVQTGLGESFVGAALVAISTSLPEISTVTSAVRIRQYEMAFSDILGTNMVDLALIFVVDLTDLQGYVLDQVGRFSLFASLLGIAVTIVYLIGLVERKNRAVLRMGIDSIVVVLVYLSGMFILFQLR